MVDIMEFMIGIILGVILGLYLSSASGSRRRVQAAQNSAAQRWRQERGKPGGSPVVFGRGGRC